MNGQMNILVGKPSMSSRYFALCSLFWGYLLGRRASGLTGKCACTMGPLLSVFEIHDHPVTCTTLESDRYEPPSVADSGQCWLGCERQSILILHVHFPNVSKIS